MSLNKRRKFAFDWDGTLVDCRARQMAVLASVWNHVVKCGKLDLESCWQLKREGMSTLQALLKIGATGKNALEVAAKWKREIEQPQWLEYDAVLPESLAALTKAVANGFSVVVITARTNPGNVQKQISSSCLSSMIDDVHVVEPACASEQKATVLKQQKVKAFVGDSESDFQAAQRAGVLFAGVVCGQRSLSCLENLGVAPLFAGTLEATNDLLVRAANIVTV